MFLPEVIYEKLPYGYFLISAFLLIFYDSWLVFISAGLFYSTACIILVTRSGYRRVDRFKNKKRYKERFPRLVYEYLPYVCFAVAIMTLIKTSQPALQFLACYVIIRSLRNLIFRRYNRRKAKTLF